MPVPRCNPGLHVNGSHYVNWDTAAVVELCNSRVFDDFPKLKLIIPHGGGAIRSSGGGTARCTSCRASGRSRRW